MSGLRILGCRWSSARRTGIGLPLARRPNANLEETQQRKVTTAYWSRKKNGLFTGMGREKFMQSKFDGHTKNRDFFLR